MNVLVLSADDASTIVAAQTGQHRLGPVPLTDGRFFLSADVMTEPHFAAHLDNVDYDTATLDDVRDSLPVSEDGV